MSPPDWLETGFQHSLYAPRQDDSLPSHEEFAEFEKEITRWAFGHDISKLVLSFDRQDLDDARSMRPQLHD